MRRDRYAVVPEERLRCNEQPIVFHIHKHRNLIEPGPKLLQLRIDEQAVALLKPELLGDIAFAVS